MGKVYISGSITSDKEHWKQRFAHAHKYLNSIGYKEVVDPQEMDSEFSEKELWDKPYSFFMNRDLIALSECDTIYLLTNWKKSKGAKLELHYAKLLGMKVIKEKRKNAWRNN